MTTSASISIIISELCVLTFSEEGKQNRREAETEMISFNFANRDHFFMRGWLGLGLLADLVIYQGLRTPPWPPTTPDILCAEIISEQLDTNEVQSPLATHCSRHGSIFYFLLFYILKKKVIFVVCKIAYLKERREIFAVEGVILIFCISSPTGCSLDWTR